MSTTARNSTTQERPKQQEKKALPPNPSEKSVQSISLLLPPGFINHGNTCFMNSVLQGLLATPLFRLLVLADPIPPRLLELSSSLLASERSPQITNAHHFSHCPQLPFIDSMPIGDVLLNLSARSWSSQFEGKKETLTPKAVLTVVGKKYDQYTDFIQQDAHEFLRILLDASKMEELDVIKKRQPPPSPNPSLQAISQNKPPLAEKEQLMPFSDMIFGGRLASFLVCQKCKHISQMYEEFNDLSLPIKPDDYVRERKRDRFKKFAQRLKFSTNTNAPTPAPVLPQIRFSQTEHPRSSSVPPTPRLGDDLADGPPLDSERRLSVDVLTPQPSQTNPHTLAIQSPTPPPSEVHSSCDPPSAPPSDTPDDNSADSRRVEFKGNASASGKPKDKSKTRDGWNKLGRRISLTVGLGKVPPTQNNRHSRDLSRRDQRSAGDSQTPSSTALSSTTADSLPQIILSRPGSPTGTDGNSQATTLLASSARSSPTSNGTSSMNGHKTSPKKGRAVHKGLASEAEYLRRILADVVTSSSTSQFPFFKASTSPTDQWGRVSSTSGTTSLSDIEECLKMFTSVENLDGDNMVGCRRCWKMEHGLWPPSAKSGRRVEEPQDSGSESDAEDNDTTALEKSLPPPPLAASVREHDSQQGSTSSSSLPSDGSAMRPSYDEPVTARPSDPHFPVNTSTPAFSSVSTGRPLPSVPPGVHVNGSQSLGSLEIPPANRRQRRQRAASNADSVSTSTSLDSAVSTTDDEYNDDSDASATTNPGVLSDRSTGSSVAVPHNGAQPPVPPLSSRPKPKKKPRPVKKAPAYKRYLIDIPPPVLVIHLKRFQQLAQASSRSRKIDDFVRFPEILDMKPFLAPRKQDFGVPLKKRETGMVQRKDHDTCLYRLYAVVVHVGNMLGGHYVAYVALPSPMTVSPQGNSARVERQWAYISDAVVRLATLDEVLKSKAYICFYERI